MSNKFNITQWLENDGANNLIDTHGGFYNSKIKTNSGDQYGILIDIPSNADGNFRVQYFTSWYGNRFFRTKREGNWLDSETYWDGWKSI